MVKELMEKEVKIESSTISNIGECIELIERFIRLFGIQALSCLTADREIVGDKWIRYPNDQNIRYYIRIRYNFWCYNLTMARR